MFDSIIYEYSYINRKQSIFFLFWVNHEKKPSKCKTKKKLKQGNKKYIGVGGGAVLKFVSKKLVSWSP